MSNLEDFSKPGISVVIVSYNVKFYCEQCIHSVLQSQTDFPLEIIVVDNDSQDESPEYLKSKFPEIVMIASPENLGFGKANNLGIDRAKGEYILILNPDMVLPEDCLQKCYEFMKSHPDCGALGPKLIDGTGTYLPESKRGFPSLMTALYKFTGLNKIFPHSAKFNKYYLGNLPTDQTNPIDVLVGCFMLIPREILQEVQGFDTDFFMYGEDIDLSYRIKQAGYQNYYFPETTVIHYKGESTNKGSLEYVKMFYDAMLVFSEKHFSPRQNRVYKLFIRLAMIFKSILAFFGSIFSRVKLYLLDFVFAFLSLELVQNFWSSYVKPDVDYQTKLTSIAFALYALVWVSMLYFNGVYDKPYKRFRIWRGGFMGIAAVLVLYSLLPLEYRFSRGITLFGTLLASFMMIAYRAVFSWLKIKGFDFNENDRKGIIQVGDITNEKRIAENFNTDFLKLDIKGSVSESAKPVPDNYLGAIEDLENIVKSLQTHELIFSYSPVLSYKKIINWFQVLQRKYEFKIFRPKAMTIIGSNSKNTAGDLYSLDPVYMISTFANKRNKRVLDLTTSAFILLLFPVFIFILRKVVWQNIFAVLLSQKTWIGYPNMVSNALPDTKDFVFDIAGDADSNSLLAEKIRQDYALHYDAYRDFRALWAALFS